MFEKIKQQITDSIGENSQISEKTIDSFAKTYDTLFKSLGVNEEKLAETDFFKNEMVNLLKNDVQSNINAIAAVVSKSEKEKALKELEEKYKNKNQGNNDDDDATKKLREDLEVLKEQITKEKKEAERVEKIKNNKKAFIDSLKKEKIDSEWYNDYLDQITITEDTDVDDLTKKAVKYYNKTKANKAGGGTPGKAGGSYTQDDFKKMYESAKEKLKSNNN